jgi:hypothetical protein
MPTDHQRHDGSGGAEPGGHGRAVQVDPVKPTLKPPGTKHLKLKSDKPLSKFAFNFNLRRYTMGSAVGAPPQVG